MAITSQDGLVAAVVAGQSVLFNKANRNTVASGWFTMLDTAGNPGAGTLAGTSTAAGVVPTDATAGFPPINAFSGINTGYISSVDFGNTLAGRLRLADLLFKAGAYAFNANVTLAAQPSYASRIASGDYKGTELWIEAVTAFTGNLSVAVTYTNQDGVAGRTTGTVATGVAPTVGRMIQLPLQTGDSGVQKIESVVASVATAGTFNLLVLRPLWMARVRTVNDGGSHGPDLTDLPVVFADSALLLMVNSDTANSGVPDLNLGVING